jgi:2-dehydro-3-deoxyphosphogluconate aldolase / (4S)-4-hydroxy-2-oxoglutarate aldolase
MRQPASLLQGLEQAGILAVLRAPSAGHAVRAVDALVAGGVLGIEITYSTPDAADAIAEAARRHGDAIYLGAGTVLTAPRPMRQSRRVRPSWSVPAPMRLS